MERLSGSPVVRLVRIEEGNVAFVPEPLPESLSLGQETVALLDAASRAVGILVGTGETIPNPHILIRPLLRREAVLSSRIEGTMASLSDVASAEAGPPTRPQGDVREVMNYVEAVDHGLQRLERLPISYRLVLELHDILMREVRGQETRPGAFRDTQVYIGPPGSPIEDARFVPPPAQDVRDLFQRLEEFTNRREGQMPPLVRCALMHYQFETIHPFRDGNGRIGRLLITLFLQESGLLTQPLLHLSAYFERDRGRYYDELLHVSTSGDYERWVRYFLIGVEREARDTSARVRRLREVQEGWRDLLRTRGESANGLRLLDEICARLIITAPAAASFLGITDAGARRVLERLIDAGIVWRLTGTRPNLYVVNELFDVIEGEGE
ncbi:MAG: Fic family protein [Caldilineaceae bacterium]|nr:Fic family protein [Caldilineaceae bacterium]